MDLGILSFWCDHSICPKGRGSCRRRLMFLSLLVTILVAGLATTADRAERRA